MRTLRRNNRTIYIAKRNVSDEGVEWFDPPVSYQANPMPVTASFGYQVIAMGMVAVGTLVFVADIKDKELFNMGDRVYVDTEVESPFDGNASGADYKVESVLSTLSLTSVNIVRLNK
jgi:hypothetical protein